MKDEKINGRQLKRLLSAVLTLVMVITLIQANSMMIIKTVYASSPITFRYNYAYDCQRDPAYPKKGDSFSAYSFANPLISYRNKGTKSNGNWTLTSKGMYSGNKSDYTGAYQSGDVLKAVVSSIAGKYNIANNKVEIYELKDGEQHIAYGVLCAVSDDVAVYIGDTWSGGGGYVLSNAELKNTYNTTITKDIITGFAATDTWNYSVGTGDDANKLTATCNGECGTVGAHKVTLTLIATSPIYSGSDVKARFEVGQSEAWKTTMGKVAPAISYQYKATSDASWSDVTETKNAGFYKASITEGGKTASVEYQVIPKALISDDITVEPTSYDADGQQKTPTVTVLDGEQTLTKDTDYELSGETTGTAAKEYTVTITGKGNYTGTVNKTWNIVTVTAPSIYDYTDPVSSGNSADNSSSTTSTSTENFTIPVQSENTVEVKAEIKDGTANISEITSEMIEQVTESKSESKKDTIKIDLSGAKQDVTCMTISKKSVKYLAKATKDTSNGIDTVTIELSKATVVLDGNTLETLATDAKGKEILLVVDDNEQKMLNKKQKDAVKDYHVAVCFEAYFTSDGERIHDFKGGKAEVAIEFKIEKGKSVNHYHMVHLAEDGKMTRFKTKYQNGKLVFTTTHFSDYAVIYDESEVNETGKEDKNPVLSTPTKAQIAENTLALNKGFQVSQTGSKINVSWGKVEDADGYLVYTTYCGRSFGKAVKTVTNSSKVPTIIKKLNGKKLDRKKNFKVYVKAFKLIDGKKVAYGKTITAHITGVKNAKYTNAKEIVLTSKSKLKLAVGKTSEIKAKVVLVDSEKKQLSDAHAAMFRYASSNKDVASVDKNGKIKAKAKGTCYIYVYAKNGYAKKITVTVR